MSLNHFPSDHPDKQWWTQYQHHHQSAMESSKPSFTNHPQPMTATHHPLWSSSANPHHHQAWLNNSPPHFRNSLSLNLNTHGSPNHDVSHQFRGGGGGDELEDDNDNTSNNHNNSSGNRESQIMFEKPLTPSDVGKLNRLVIPKQHAEKYFPLNSSTSSGGDSGGGMLLSFEDESGKLWRFRYSYWNSSQSYVLTKGWSRYVKEKRLDAGDVVLFERHLTDPDRLFIGWRRRVDVAATSAHHQDAAALLGGTETGNSSIPTTTNVINSSNGEWTSVFYSAHHQHPYPSQPSPYQPADCLHAAAAGNPGTSGRNQMTTPVGNSRRSMRLFGVNMECQVDEDDDDGSSEQATPDDNTSSLSSSSGHYHQHHQFYPEFHAHNDNHMMDVAIARDANQMRNRRGG